MKRHLRLISSLSFMLIALLTAGLLLFFSSQDFTYEPDNDESAIAASETSATIVAFTNSYKNIDSNGELYGNYFAIGFEIKVQYHDNPNNIIVTARKYRGDSAQTVSVTGTYGINIGLLSRKERRVFVDVSTGSNCRVSNVYLEYYRGDTFIETIYDGSLGGFGQYVSFNTDSNTEKNTKVQVILESEANYTLRSTLNSYSTSFWQSLSGFAVDCSSNSMNNFDINGYTLNGFYTKESGGELVIYKYSNGEWRWHDFVEPGTTLYAQYTANEYDVALDQYGGGAGSPSVTATYGQPMPSFNLPRRYGYIFNGYYTGINGTGTKYYNADGTSARNWDIAEDGTRLYAYWTLDRFPVNIDFYSDGVLQSKNDIVGLSYDVKVKGADSGLSETNVFDFNKKILYSTEVEISNIRYKSSEVMFAGYTLSDSSCETDDSNNTNIKFNVPFRSLVIKLYFITNNKLTIDYGNGNVVMTGVSEKTLYEITVPDYPGYQFENWTLAKGTNDPFGPHPNSDGSYIIYDGSKFLETDKFYTSMGEESFNGTSDYINLGRNYMFTDKFMFSCWAMVDDWASLEKRWEVGIISSTESGGWNIENVDGFIIMACYERNNGYKNAVSNVRWSSLNAGWHHFACSFDGQYAKLFLDGVQIAQSERFINGIHYNPNNSMIIGGEAGPGSTPTYFFKGKLKNIILVNEYLNDVHVDTDAQGLKAYIVTGTDENKVTASWMNNWVADVVNENNILTPDANGEYLISTPEQLARLSYEVNYLNNKFEGKTLKLTKNINLDGTDWLPIGRNMSGTDVFSGTFDGQNFTISNVQTYDFSENVMVGEWRDSFKYVGIFGNIKNALINNLNVTVKHLVANERCGGVVGIAETSTIENCMVSPSETGAGMIESYWEAAGICGYNLDSKLENCINKCNLKGRYTGGIVGRIYQNEGNTSSITKCINFGDIGVSSLVEGEYSGGIVAITDGCEIFSCVNYGNYSANYLHAIGGIGGWLRGNNHIAACANYGNITENTGKVVASSALVGRNSGVSMLVASFAQSKLVSSSNSSNLFVSMNSSTFDVDTCYAKVDIGSITYKHVYGTAENLNTYFRYKQGVNNDLPIVIELFEYAQHIEKSNDILSEGFAGFEHVG